LSLIILCFIWDGVLGLVSRLDRAGLRFPMQAGPRRKTVILSD